MRGKGSQAEGWWLEVKRVMGLSITGYVSGIWVFSRSGRKKDSGCWALRVKNLVFRIWKFGNRVQEVGVYGSGCRIQGLGCRVCSLGFRVSGLGFGV